MLKRIPFLTRRELAAIIEQAERHPDGCLLLTPHSPSVNPNSVMIRGAHYKATRVVWAETHGEKDRFNEREVVHIAECRHTGGHDGRHLPVCINPEHLMLGERIVERVRQAVKRRRGRA